MEAVREDLGKVTHYEVGESPEYATMRLSIWLFVLGMAVLVAVQLAGV
ncbi:MAG: hypothetical protein KF760_26610 [Candidatus Eremiobacteraeota bacterium]|nr:hypothetical protein [Candidatus Eremiobacteraeota bacterium]MCW5871313.1 hypothetical protein [Candidatus Eremiobacteraeota bacterium]